MVRTKLAIAASEEPTKMQMSIGILGSFVVVYDLHAPSFISDNAQIQLFKIEGVSQ